MRVILNGAAGRMGREVINAINSDFTGVELMACVDVAKPEQPFPCYTKLSEVCEKADVLIDFSHHSATRDVLDFAAKTQIPVIIATTGQTDEEREMIKEASKKVAIFFAGNMSIGIALLVELVKSAVKVFPEADVEIIETHHNQKLDVPSGTALMIANGIKAVREDASFLIGRHENGKRPQGEIGIHSIRMGKIVGIHEVKISTSSQTITLKHEAHNRGLFAEGALKAAAFMCGKVKGLYSLGDMFNK